MIGSIWAETAVDRVIGRDGQIPWKHPGDFRRFKQLTMESAVVMGRRTWESIGKPLPGRTNIVLVGKQPVSVQGERGQGTELVALNLPMDPAYVQIEAAIRVARALGRESVWFIGGASVYEAAMPFVEVIDVTTVPDIVPAAGSVVAPRIDLEVFEPDSVKDHPYELRLKVQRFWRKP
jgi:dihydrofolate reductase